MHNYNTLLATSVGKLSSKVAKLFTVTEILLVLSSVEHYLQQLNQRNEIVLRNIVDAALGHVSSSLLSLQDLRYVLAQAEHQYSLIPIFPKEEIVHYYPLLTSIIASESIIISIPFQSTHKYLVYELEPFPMLVNDSIFALDMPSSILLTNDDKTMYTRTNVDTLDSCHTAHAGLYFCPASQFAFIPVREAGVCELSMFLINSSRSLDLCPFKEVPRNSFFHETFQGFHYFMFPDPVEVTVRCVEGNTYKRVQGPLRIKKECSLSSLSVSSISEVTHQGALPVHPEFVQQLNFNVTHIKYVTNQLHRLYLTNVSTFKGAVHANLPDYLQPSTHYPITVTPIIIVLIVMLVLIYIACVMRKSTVLYTFLSRRLKRSPNSEAQDMPLESRPTTTMEGVDNPASTADEA